MPSSFVDRDDLFSSGIYRANFLHMNVRMNTSSPIQGQESCPSECRHMAGVQAVALIREIGTR